MSAIKIGLNCKFYRGAAGATAGTEIQNVKDLTMNLEVTEEDATTREGDGWETPEPILFRMSLEWEMNWKPGDANFQALRQAFFAKSAIALAALDGVGGEGIDADFKIFKFARSEPVAGIVKVSVTAKPVYVTRSPNWKT